MKITKRFHWIMGHRLTFHKGGCENIHGHNWECKVTVEGKPDNNGIVIDFEELKHCFNHFIHKQLDHAFMWYEKDEIMKEVFTKYSNLKNVRVGWEPTSENIAIYLFGIFMIYIDNINRKVTRVKVYETPTSEAIYYGEN